MDYLINYFLYVVVTVVLLGELAIHFFYKNR